MNTIEITAAPEFTAAPLVEAGKKQYTVGASYGDKLAIAELCQEFERPGTGGKTVKMSEREAIETLFKVATDRRFVTIPVMESVEIDGELFEVQAMDCDGNLQFETKDLISTAWEEIKARDYSAAAKIKSPIDQINSLAKSLKLSQDMLESLLAAAKGL
jgi:hypothetical protein